MTCDTTHHNFHKLCHPQTSWYPPSVKLSLKAIFVNDFHSYVTEDLKKTDFHIFQMTQGDQYRKL